MNTIEYAEYEAAVARALDGLTHVSSGPCPGCDECGLADCDSMDAAEYELASEPRFGSSPCDCCGSTLGGDRYYAHGASTEYGIIHFNVCVDCYYYLEYGRLDDQTMDEIEGGN